MALVVGIEGTAWAASAALYDADEKSVSIETDAYRPATGGIDPSEAAEHMHDALPEVVERVLSAVPADAEIDAVAVSLGPGLGPCLRVAGTTARALAGTLSVPIVGVNHMLAHAEVGRWAADFDRPVCLNASGANTHVLALRGDRYRVLGETADVGIGNAIDKFTRHLGWSHPGGPKVERRARDGEYVALPYTVTGMDLSFSGLMSAAKAATDDHPVADVCFSLQETAFAMLAEVAERALSLTGSDELVLGGGVAQNRRLQSMLGEMCEARGAAFHAPADRFLRDNAGMIAVLGARMLAAGDTLAVEDSRVRPNFRPDQAAVTWRDPDDTPGVTAPVGSEDATVGPTPVQGAEAVVDIDPDAGRVHKRRVPKDYRHERVDARLRRDRTVLEARLTATARREGVPTPVVHDVDPVEATLVLGYVGDRELRALLNGRARGDEASERLRTVGRHLATLHAAGVVHGDPTPRNVRVAPERTYLVDFGLGYHTDDVEDHAMDLHVLRRCLAGTVAEPDRLLEALAAGYRTAGDPAVLAHVASIERRGRYRERDGDETTSDGGGAASDPEDTA